MKNKVISLLAAALLVSACDMIPFSGGALQGELTPIPADWTQAASASVIQLETNPAEPYSVKLWIIGNGDDLYEVKYSNRPRNENVGEAYLFRLLPRS